MLCVFGMQVADGDVGDLETWSLAWRAVVVVDELFGCFFEEWMFSIVFLFLPPRVNGFDEHAVIQVV